MANEKIKHMQNEMNEIDKKNASNNKYINEKREEIIKLEGLAATDEELEAKYLEIAGGDQAKVKQVKKQYRESQVSFHIKTLKAVELVKANAVTK